MRLFGIPFNSLTATILSITIGLGIDYSVHVVHRFADEYEKRDTFDALERTVRGTGGALTGSMLTTVTGIGVLVLAITPILGQFGLLTGLSILLAYLASVFVTPSVVVVWAGARERLGLAG
jgi:predicted RND superfamily exporter protein